MVGQGLRGLQGLRVGRTISPSMTIQLYGLLYQGAAGGLFVAVIYIYIVRFLQSAVKLRHIKGPPAIPIVGNLYDLRALSWFDWLKCLRSKYGKVFRIFTFSRPYVVILDKVAVREILTDDAFVKPPSYSDLAAVLGQGLVTSSGPKHAADRATLSPFFSLPRLLKDLDVICEFITGATDRLLAKGLGKETNIVDFMTGIAADYVLFVTLSLRKKLSNHEALRESMFTASRIIGEHMILNLPWLALRLKVSGVLQAAHDLHRQIDLIIDERKELEASPDKCPDDVLTALLRRDPSCSREDIYGHVVTFLAAGIETTSYGLAYAILLLARHPEVQQRLKQEVKKVLGQRTHVTPEDYKKLTYITNIMQESLRIFAAVPQIPRIATRTVKLESSGIVIPEGTEVLLPLYLLHRDEDEWGAPIDTFNPDRFLTSGPGGKPVTREAPSKGYLPFSFGKRSCIAGTMALVEGTLTLALLAQRFTFYEVAGFEPQLKLGVTLESRNKVKVRMELDDSIVPKSQ